MAFTDGDGIKGALKWLAERRQEEPGASRTKLIDEASRRFDLTPLEADFLLNAWREDRAAGAQPGATPP
jgi:hypothetical protein